MYIDVESVKNLSALILALTTIIGLIVGLYKFYARQKKQDEELAAIRKELQLLCFGLKACLCGLHDQGCNGPVTEGLNRLDKHLNEKAHQGGGAV
jgi:hypothetical protein